METPVQRLTKRSCGLKLLNPDNIQHSRGNPKQIFCLSPLQNSIIEYLGIIDIESEIVSDRKKGQKTQKQRAYVGP